MSEPKEIPAAMLDAATEAIAATQYCSQWGAGKLAEVALNAACVPELLAQIAELEAALHNVVRSQDVAMPIELDEEITKLLSAESAEVSE